MKTKAVVLVLVLVLCGVIFAQTIDKVADLRDFLMQPPNSTYQKYGYSEDTLRLYNIIAIREAGVRLEQRIVALEVKVAELEKPAEPNDIEVVK